MQLTININDDTMTELINKSISELSSDAINDIVKNAIGAYLTKPEVLDKIFFTKDDFYSKARPTDILLKLMAGPEGTDPFENIRNEIINTVSKDRRDIIVDVMGAAFGKCLLTIEFRESIARAIANNDPSHIKMD